MRGLGHPEGLADRRPETPARKPGQRERTHEAQLCRRHDTTMGHPVLLFRVLRFLRADALPRDRDSCARTGHVRVRGTRNNSSSSSPTGPVRRGSRVLVCCSGTVPPFRVAMRASYAPLWASGKRLFRLRAEVPVGRGLCARNTRNSRVRRGLARGLPTRPVP